MAYTLDSEIAAIMASVAPNMRVAARGDWKALREIATVMSAQMMTSMPPDSDVRIKSFFAKAKDNAEIELRWYTKQSALAGPAIVYAHGGGMILGSAEMYDSIVAGYVTLMGDSAGGGVAAGTATLARDRGVPLAKQILIYPMLDDRNVSPDPSLELHATWTYDNNFTGWSALLGSEIGSVAVSPLAAPARLKDFAGLAPAYIEVGELDIFRDESISYAQRIAAAGTPLELHVHPGAPHGFDRTAPQSQLTRRAFADRTRVISGL